MYVKQNISEYILVLLHQNTTAALYPKLTTHPRLQEYIVILQSFQQSSSSNISDLVAAEI